MKISAFTKTYGGRTVLDMPETELEHGASYAVIGANGSGKSTLARILAGVEKPDGGKTVISGITVGYMPQKSYAFRMTVMRNLLVGANDEERARYLMRKLGIEHLASEPAHKLSGGETARMALARLLMRDRQLLIVDGSDGYGVRNARRAAACRIQRKNWLHAPACHPQSASG